MSTGASVDSGRHVVLRSSALKVALAAGHLMPEEGTRTPADYDRRRWALVGLGTERAIRFGEVQPFERMAQVPSRDHCLCDRPDASCVAERVLADVRTTSGRARLAWPAGHAAGIRRISSAAHDGPAEAARPARARAAVGPSRAPTRPFRCDPQVTRHGVDAQPPQPDGDGAGVNVLRGPAGTRPARSTG